MAAAAHEMVHARTRMQIRPGERRIANFAATRTQEPAWLRRSGLLLEPLRRSMQYGVSESAPNAAPIQLVVDGAALTLDLS